MTEVKTPPTDFYIVGIGASAGGLEALESFFSNCPNDTGIAFVIVQHLSPDYKSMMSSLLARHTKMPIKVSDDTDVIKPDHIYLIPGTKNLIVKNGRLQLVDRANANQLNLPIDLFFESLAIEKKEKAVGVILSGTGSDGTRGGKEIKSVGGTLFVQDPETIRFDGMPLSAIENGIADYVMTAAEIPYELVNFINFPTAKSDWEMKTLLNDEEAVNEILQIIKRNTGYDFLSYRRQTLIRRIIKRLKINKLKTLKEYIELLESDVNEQRTAVNEFLINVTKFFRDKSSFKLLEKEVLPNIIKTAYEKQKDVKAWSVACSSGEEAYSVAMLIEEVMEQLKMRVSYKVFATDIDSIAVENASKGEYKSDIANDMPPTLLNKYFVQKNNGYQIKTSIRKNIIFSKHDILHNPPFNKMDLVSCRNMLIYLNNNAQRKALASLHFSLKLNGYLFLGSSESLGSLKESFEQINPKIKIYKNINSSNRVFRDKNDLEMYSFSPSILSKGMSPKERFDFFIGQDLLDAVDAICIFINDRFDIIHAKGPLHKFFALPTDGFSNNIMSVLPNTLNIPISTSIRKLKRNVESKKVIVKEIQYIKEKELTKIQIRVRDLPAPMQAVTYLITIIEIGKIDIQESVNKEGAATAQESIKYQDEIKELRQALIDSKENLQMTVEELETTNEEIQSTNEELIASNEELQSTNEELQSVNEELHTVNAELQEKNTELLTLNADMENLINSTDIGTIFLDKDFKIRKFTPAITYQMHLQKSDIGRPVSDFSWHSLNIEKDARKVLKKLQPIRKEFQTKEGIWYLQQVQPYRTQDDLIKGVVINFINIESLKSAVQEKEEVNHFLKKVTNLSAGIIYVFDLEDKKFAYVSKAVELMLGYSIDQVKQMDLSSFETILSPFYKNRIKEHYEEIKIASDVETKLLEFKLTDINRREVWISTLEKVFERNAKGKVTKVIGFALDNTEQMKLIERENESLHFIKEVTALSPDIVYVYDPIEDRTDYANRSLLKQLKPNATSNSFKHHPFIDVLHPADLKAYKAHLKKIKTSKKDVSLYLELRLKDKSDTFKWVSITEKAFDRQNGKVSRIIGTIKDIHAFRQVKLEKEKLEKLRYALKESNEKLERFAYISSHDLKEPLNTIISGLDLMKLGFDSPESMELIQPIEESTQRMKNLIDDLLHYSLLNKKPLQLQNISLNNLLEEVQEDMRAALQHNDTKLAITALPEIYADRTLIKQVFQNLIGNAIKYNDKEKPLIEISAKENKTEFTFSVKDNGIGIAEKHFEKVFDVFKTLHNKDQYHGTGIGLSNCKTIVHAHKGKIWIESVLGQGSTFYFNIPKSLNKEKLTKNQTN